MLVKGLDIIWTALQKVDDLKVLNRFSTEMAYRSRV